MLMCAHVVMNSLRREHLTLIASRARAMGEPTRLRILEVLERGEQAVGHIAQALTTQQSTVSRHLQVLYQAGLVHRRREASAVIYSIASHDLLPWLRYLGHRQLRARRKGAPGRERV
jgi:DNA-binding transcriptional ArsR family regulator